MNACMTKHANQAEHDAAREEWFAMRLERQRERQRKAKMATAQEAFIREWWDLPDEIILSKKKPGADDNKPERIGGMPASQQPPNGGR